MALSSWIFGPLLLFIVVLLRRARSKHRFPPGPVGLPLLGNIFQVPKAFPWHKFTEWKGIYGPLFSLNLAGQTMIVLNSHQACIDLLERRSEMYSHRPRFIVSGLLMTGGISILLSDYGELWRSLRRLAHEGLNLRVAQTYHLTQEFEAARLLDALVNSSERWIDHINHTIASATRSLVYGQAPLAKLEGDDDDDITKWLNDAMHAVLRASLPGAHLVDLLPVLKYLPLCLAPWKRKALAFYAENLRRFSTFMEPIRDPSASGSPSIAQNILQHQQRYNLTDTHVDWLAATLLQVTGAGSETMAATMQVFVLAMVLHPGVQVKAQAELDAVVGRDRLPKATDSLPYIRCIVRETMRWRPVGPLGVPRRCAQDNIYNGLFIPEGAIIVPNTWALNRDPDVYGPDFDDFCPERFEIDEHPSDELTHGQGHTTFGFGRRSCSGIHVANNALFVNFAFILWAFSMESPVVPSPDSFVEDGLVVRPTPFPCVFKPRSKDVEVLIRSAVEAGIY